MFVTYTAPKQKKSTELKDQSRWERLKALMDNIQNVQIVSNEPFLEDLEDEDVDNTNNIDGSNKDINTNNNTDESDKDVDTNNDDESTKDGSESQKSPLRKDSKKKTPRVPIKPIYITPKFHRLEEYQYSSSPLTHIFEFFTEKGLSEEASAGLVGNFLSESSLNPKAVNEQEQKRYSKYGQGIAQWSNDRISQFIKYIGKDPKDATLDEQLDFVWEELQQRPVLLNSLYKVKTASEAADLIYRGYENGFNNGLATPEQLTKVYSRAWDSLGYRNYDYNTETLLRQQNAENALQQYSLWKK